MYAIRSYYVPSRIGPKPAAGSPKQVFPLPAIPAANEETLSPALGFWPALRPHGPGPAPDSRPSVH